MCGRIYNKLQEPIKNKHSQRHTKHKNTSVFLEDSKNSFILE